MSIRQLEPYEREFIKILAKGIKIRKQKQREGVIKK